MSEATQTRMGSEERREQLLQAGLDLLRHRPNEGFSIEEIAEAAGVSKGLLYHYFPTKKDFVLAAIERGQENLFERVRPDPDLSPEAQLRASLENFLDYVEEHATVYLEIYRSGSGDPDIAAVVQAGRSAQMQTLLRALSRWDASPVSTEPTPILETAIQGWMYFLEGAVLRWVEERDVDRADLVSLLQAAFGGALVAARVAGGQPVDGNGPG